MRDLLLGLRPKDYDIATAARPQQVKRTFPRNCRIIGRRFKLAHLHFHGNTKILEVSTFRRSPQTESAENTEQDLLIKQDNEFGTAQEDALRRDFTVNALFLDVGRNQILDYADGLSDIRTRTIRTIGDPRVRFREDPVRILRAVKFAGRLQFHIEPDTLAAMAEAAPDLVRAAPPRLLEEIQRLLRSGHALDSFQLLRDVGALKSLLPVVSDFLADAAHGERVAFWRLLEAVDHAVLDGHVPSAPVLLGALLYPAVAAKAQRHPQRSPATIAEDLLGPLCMQLRLPRRDTGCLKRICSVQRRFLQIADPQGFKVEGFASSPYFDEALLLFRLRTEASGTHQELLDPWLDLRDQAPSRAPGAEPGEDEDFRDEAEPAGSTTQGRAQADGQEQGEGEGRRRRRRRRGRRGRRGGEDTPDAEHEDRQLPAAEAEAPDREEPADESSWSGEEGEDAPDASAQGEGGEAEPRHGRSRRRRRRRRGGRDDGGEPQGNGQARQQQQPQQQRKPQQQPQQGRKDRNRRRGRREGNRDVDVVPRGMDRRGKIEVIEPQQLDLSAFDIELDPKRVPTFGSIVEGKGRPKRKAPRLPDEGRDDYRPPPPPGQGDPSSAPPPPPPADDTFGDW